jgi:hypothetical protein
MRKPPRGHRELVGETWRRLRRPFAIPRLLHGTVCKNHEAWEAIDIDLSGCRRCGEIHDCQTEKDCVLEVDNCSTVCTITGFCVKEKMFAETEFADTVILQRGSSSPRSRQVEYEMVLMHVSSVLCSDDARQCLAQENARVSQKLQHLFYRILKEYKLGGHRVPNLCSLAAALAARARSVRMCPIVFDLGKRMQVSRVAAKAITRLACALTNVYPDIFRLMRIDLVVIGLLYLMRSGLVLHGVTVLPSHPELTWLLPLESYLFPCFQIRCKTITEVENLVKINVRLLSGQQLQRLGINGIDQIISQ